MAPWAVPSCASRVCALTGAPHWLSHHSDGLCRLRGASAPSSKAAMNWELLRGAVLPSPRTLGMPVMCKIQARKTNPGEGVALVALFLCCLCCSTGAGAGLCCHTPVSPGVSPGVSPVSLTTPHHHHHELFPALGPLSPALGIPTLPALLLSWISPCSTDPNFYSIPETFCSAFFLPPPSSFFIFHYLLQTPHSQVRRQEILLA